MIAWDRNPAQTVIHHDQTCSYISDKDPPNSDEPFEPGKAGWLPLAEARTMKNAGKARFCSRCMS